MVPSRGVLVQQVDEAENAFANSGMLNQTSGPLKLPAGKLVARFHSIWRLDTDGRWRVVFDDGQDVCDCAAAKP